MSDELTRLANAVVWPGFLGTRAPAWLLAELRDGLAGVVYFGQNVGPEISELSAEILEANPLALIGVDEEGAITTTEVAAASAPAPAQAATAPIAPAAPAAAASPSGPQKATRDAVSRIVITSGPKAGLELPLGSEPLTIGRSSESGLVIRDDYTSSHHARLLLRGDTWAVQDLDSTNGTFVGGKRVTGGAVSLALGTPVKVGATTFELRA